MTEEREHAASGGQMPASARPATPDAVDDGGRWGLHLVLVPAAATACVLVSLALPPGLVWIPALVVLAVTLASALGQRQRLDALRQERHTMDDRLLQTQKLAALGEMAAGIAHEINTPLAIIGQEAEWMEHLLGKAEAGETLSVAEYRDSVHQVGVQVQRCAGITHSILGFAAKRKAVVQKVSLNKLTDDMVRWIEREARQRDIVIHRDYDENLPELATDPPLLRQVLLNLLSNAYQAVDHDGAVFIVTRRRDPATACIEIRDTGPGIAQEHLDKIFNPFFTTKAPGKGTGLGLSISLAIVNRLGGTLTVASEPGKGATFTIALPLQGQGSEESA